MNTRITMHSIVQGALTDTRRLTDQLAALQTQASTGKRLASVSDDPATALTILGHEVQAQNYAVHLENIGTATSRLNASVSTLQQVEEVFTQARSIAIEASSSVNDASAFETLAQSIDNLIGRLVNLANTQNNGMYLFGGTASRTAPFVVTQADAQGRPAAVAYQGATEATSAFVDRARQVALEYPGDQIFQTRQRQATVFAGATGAQPGTGTDNATGRAELVLRHTATTYAAGSGVQPGASSAAGDTILGPLGRHTLHITDTSGTGAAGTVSLDGGPPLAFTSADGDLRVVNTAGDVVYVDMTAITPSFDGAVDLTSSGTMSIDGGATSTALTFAANQSASDSITGKVTNVDTTNAERIGNEAVSYPGTLDAFQALITLRDDLRNTRHLSEHDQIEAISGNLAELERIHGNVLDTVGAQAAALQSLEMLQTHLQDLQLNARKTASELGDVDMAELVVKLQAHQNMLQFSLATFARIVDQNLLDFLR